MMNSEGQEMGFLENGRLLLSCCLALVGLAFGAPAAAQISFSVTLPQSATSEPVTGRLIVVTTRRAADGAPAKVEPRQSIGMNGPPAFGMRSEEHTSELQSLMRISYAVFCLKKTNHHNHALSNLYY